MARKTSRETLENHKTNKFVTNIDRIPELTVLDKAELRNVTDRFPFRATHSYLRLIDWSNPSDPIRRLVIPNLDELNSWGLLDPSNEESVTVAQGIQHKYSSTVLLIVTEACGAACRYCFRKRIFMSERQKSVFDLDEAVRYIRSRPEVDNVLLTGGDPLMLSTRRLSEIISRLIEIENVKMIRIGTKIPAFDPLRISQDQDLLKILSNVGQSGKRIYAMCHFDHPNELSADCKESISMLQRAGVICANQHPIVRGISDDPQVLSRLWNELSYMGVPPYYVFQNRPTVGNEPFKIPIVEAYYRIEQAKRTCSGLAKRARYVMSHETGKLEIIGVDRDYIYLKYHRAKYVRDEQRLIICHRDDDAYWFDNLEQVDSMQRAG